MSKIRLESDGTYTIDFVKRFNGNRVHITRKGYKSIEEAESHIPILLEERIARFTKKKASGMFSDFFETYIEHRSHKVSPSTLLAIKAVYNVVLSS